MASIPCPRCGIPVQPDWDCCHGCGFDPDGLKPPVSLPAAPVGAPPVAPHWSSASPPAGRGRASSGPPLLPLPSGGDGEGRGLVVGLVVAGVLAGAVLLAIVVVVARSGGSTSAVSGSSTSVTTGQPPTTPTSAVSPELAALGARYLAAVGPYNAAKAAFFRAEEVAKSTPCTCPRGQFDFRNWMDAFPAVNQAERAFAAELRLLAPDIPASAAADLQALIDGTDGQAAATQTIIDLGDTNAQVRERALDEMDLANNNAAAAAGRLRRDLQLPPTS